MNTRPFPVTLRSWFHRYARWLARDARGRLGPGEVESLADLAAVQAWGRFDPSRGLAFTTFARKAVMGTVRRAIARHDRARHVVASYEEFEGFAVGPTAEDVHAARQLIARLDPLDLAILTRHAVAEEPIDEIARALELPRTTVWRRLQEAKALAREGRWRREAWVTHERARNAAPGAQAEPLPAGHQRV